jgi:hypothetical protein
VPYTSHLYSPPPSYCHSTLYYCAARSFVLSAFVIHYTRDLLFVRMAGFSGEIPVKAEVSVWCAKFCSCSYSAREGRQNWVRRHSALEVDFVF